MRGFKLAACGVLLATAPGCYDYGGFFSKQPDPAALQMGVLGSGSLASLTGFQKVTQQAFDALPVGMSSTPFTITIKNTGELVANHLSFTLTSSDPGSVKSFALQNRCKDSLVPKTGRGGVVQENTCQVDVIFSPVKLNGINAQLVMAYDDGNGKPMTAVIPLSGSADTRAYLRFESVDPSLWVGPAGQQSLFLGAVSSPYSSTAVVHVIYNGDLFPDLVGISPASSVKFAISSNTADGAFSVQASSPSQTAMPLCPGIGNAAEGTIQHSCYLFVQFSPTAKQPYTGAAVSASYANGSEGKTVQMPLSGTGNDVIQPASLSVSFNKNTAVSYDFGPVAVNPTPLSVISVTITNNGTAPAVGISSTLSALQTQGFQLSQAAGDTNCALLTAPAGQGTLAPGSTCQIGLSFNPQSKGAVSNTVSFTYQSQGPHGPVADAASPFSFKVTGNGVNPAKLLFSKTNSATDSESLHAHLFGNDSFTAIFKNTGDISAVLGQFSGVQVPLAALFFRYQAQVGSFSQVTPGGLILPNASLPTGDYYLLEMSFNPTLVSQTQTITEIFPYANGSGPDQLQVNLTAVADPNEVLWGPYFSYSNIILKPGLSPSDLSTYLSKMNLSQAPLLRLYGPNPLSITMANIQPGTGAALSGNVLSQGPLSLDFTGCLAPAHQLLPASANFNGANFCLGPALSSTVNPVVDGPTLSLEGVINYDDGTCKGKFCQSTFISGSVNFVSPPAALLSANAFDFETLAQAASTSTPQTVSMANSSKLFALFTPQLSVTDPKDPNLDLIKISPAAGNSTYLSTQGSPPNSTNTYSIAIVPKRSGTFKINLSASFKYVDSTSHSEPVSLPITVTVVITSAPKLAVQPPVFTKILLAAGASTDADLTIANNGTGAATLAQLPALSGEFGYTPGGGPGAGVGYCAVGTVLAPSATCKLTVRFTPISIGIHTLGVSAVSQEDAKNPAAATLTGIATTMIKIFAGSNTTCIYDEIRILRCWGRNAPTAVNISTPGAVNFGVNPVSVGKVAIGPNHVCAVVSIAATNEVNQVYCWGDNSYGQLGLGLGLNSPSSLNLTDSNVVLNVSVNLGTDKNGKAHQALDLAVGAEHACALLEEGSVKCWGRNDSGQLGNAAVTSIIGNDPASLGNNMIAANLKSPATAIGAGAGHTCALLSGGAVKCWGDNFYGQLGQVTSGGNGTNKLGLLAADFDSLNPIDFGSNATAVTGLGLSSTTAETCTVSKITSQNTLGVKCFGKTASEDGSFFGLLGVCWGRPGSMTSVAQVCSNGLSPTSELGKILTDVQNLIPTPIGDGSANVIKLAVGHQHSCVLLDDKSIRCWGYNSQGQLGNSSLSSAGQDPSTMGTSLVPIVVTADGGTQVADLAVGDNHTCVVLEDNTIKCWGSGTEGASSPLPMTDTGSKPVSQLPIVYTGK